MKSKYVSFASFIPNKSLPCTHHIHVSHVKVTSDGINVHYDYNLWRMSEEDAMATLMTYPRTEIVEPDTIRQLKMRVPSLKLTRVRAKCTPPNDGLGFE